MATNNAYKLQEVRQILGDRFHVKGLAEIGCHEDIPETAATLEGIVYYFFHNLVNAAMYGLCLRLMSPAEVPVRELVTLTGAFLFAWIIGFITPGAPGGIGIRESVMLLVSGEDYAQPVMRFVLVMRVASVAADVLAFVIGTVCMRRNSAGTEDTSG